MRFRSFSAEKWLHIRNKLSAQDAQPVAVSYSPPEALEGIISEK
jgi:hypothetical protein